MTDAFEVQDDLSSAQSSTNETFVTETLALDAADVHESIEELAHYREHFIKL